ncbi:Scr1 family TA system antitoxin-like transcriptional regulator [Streptosporangium sp. NPDC002721]|uniref:helix-turn-helix domain-containing protein n=1 Tax=Streptosporangium sp. NPDC002721 TaxID=3366188 RepID=UPI0036C8B37E
MPPARELDPGASPVAFFGAELRRYRTERAWSQEKLAEQINYSLALVGMIENARRVPSRDFTARCDDVLETGGALSRLWPLLSREAYPTWFRPFVELEREATSLKGYEPLVLPGLFQIEDYARAMLVGGRPGDTPEQIDEMVAARLERQAILERSDPPVFWVVLDEGVLHRAIGGPEIMQRQLEHLVKLGRHPRITIQIVPKEVAAHPGLAGAFVIAGFRNGPDVVYLETAAHGHLVQRREDIETVAYVFDALRAEALPQRASLELIARMIA